MFILTVARLSACILLLVKPGKIYLNRTFGSAGLIVFLLSLATTFIYFNLTSLVVTHAYRTYLHVFLTVHYQR